MSSPVEDGALLIDPEPACWPALMARRAAGPGWADAARFREQMGLASGVPMVLSGHQAGLWHPGIAAKYFALGAVSGLASTAWLIADLDENRPTRVRVPERDARGVWKGAWVELADGDAGHPDAACGYRAPVSIRRDVPERAAFAASAFAEARAGAVDLAVQAHRAAEMVLERAGVPRVAAVIRGSATGGTDLFAGLIERMCDDPGACVEAYNAAAAAYPRAGVRALMCRPQRGSFELPLWVVGANEARRPVIVERGRELERSGLVPRGLLMTGMLRLAGCELFIHGTGGGEYDRVTEAWLRWWLGDEAVMAPCAVVSATRLLDLGVPAVDRREVERAVAAAHRAGHDPGLLGDAKAAAEKAGYVAEIARLPRGSPERARAFGAMHSVLRGSVERHAGAVASLERDAAGLVDALASSEAARDRTWSIALHGAEALSELHEQVVRAFGAIGVRRPL